ncbi:MAG: putative toxin-antitoxin system toxin component, PIN family [Candidatus Bipolaricaulota bacterium]|nr:MAG: putative toxin-antitoxin system toxin component, PIN family [Candidatus Bipolaricaulota bacterium]
MERGVPRIVVDTNVFVAAGFHRRGAAAQLLDLVRRGALRMVWSEETRRETRLVLEKIPPLSWTAFSELFHDRDRHQDELRPERFPQIPDPDDRKFAALAYVSGAILVSQDEDLLAQPERLEILVLSPRELLGELAKLSDGSTRRGS